MNPLLRLGGVAALATVLCVHPALGSTPDQIAAELEGVDEATSSVVPTPDPAARTRALEMLPETGLILIPESSNDRVMAFDPMTGDLIDADFIPADPDNLSTPIQVLVKPDGTGYLLSDQLEDVVQEYDLDGNYVGIFAPAGGVDTSILDNIRGIEYSATGTLLVSVGGGANEDAIAEFDSTGTYLGNFVTNGAGGLDSPFDVLARGSDFLVPGITSDIIHRYDLSGAALMDLAPIDNFPEQVAEAANGNILVGNFGGAQEGVVELDPSGAVVGVYDPASLGGYRGAYELPNGNILTTNGGGVHEIDRNGTLVETKIGGVSARFITLALPAGQQTPAQEIPALSPLGLSLLALGLVTLALAALRRRRA